MNLLKAGMAIALTALPRLWGQAPSITPGGIVNSVTYGQAQPVTQGSLVAIFGSQLAVATALSATIPLATTLSNASVTFDGISAPLAFVSAGQINAQVPWEVLGGGTGTSTVVVTSGGSPSAPQTVQIGPASPGVYATAPSATMPVSYAIAINAADPTSQRYGTIAAPSGAIPGLTTFPAQVGDLLIVYATGLGSVGSPPATGANSADKLRATTATPIVMIGGQQANVAFSGLSPQYVGVYQLNLFVPKVASGSAVPIQIQLGGLVSPASANIAVQ